MNLDILKEKTLLIAEDDTNSRLLIEEFLSEYVNNLIFARNGEQVVELVKENEEIDIILMDFNLPVLSGFEASEKIKEFSNVTIIAQTASLLTKETQLKLNRYFDDYILKPFNREDLINIICKHLCVKDI